MEKQNKKNTAADFDAVNEGSITKENLLTEILNLLKEDFIGIFSLENDAIKMRFLNGDKFTLTLSE